MRAALPRLRMDDSEPSSVMNVFANVSQDMLVKAVDSEVDANAE